MSYQCYQYVGIDCYHCVSQAFIHLFALNVVQSLIYDRLTGA